MSTRSRIGIEGEDGTIRSIYCHHDGYLDGVGSELLANWNGAERAVALMQHGNLSALEGADFAPVGSRGGGTVAYSRWRGETGVEAQDSADRAAYLALAKQTGGEFAYLYGPTGWEYAEVPWGDRPQQPFQPLTEATLAGEDEENEA